MSAGPPDAEEGPVARPAGRLQDLDVDGGNLPRLLPRNRFELDPVALHQEFVSGNVVDVDEDIFSVALDEAVPLVLSVPLDGSGPSVGRFVDILRGWSFQMLWPELRFRLWASFDVDSSAPSGFSVGHCHRFRAVVG